MAPAVAVPALRDLQLHMIAFDAAREARRAEHVEALDAGFVEQVRDLTTQLEKVNLSPARGRFTRGGHARSEEARQFLMDTSRNCTCILSDARAVARRFRERRFRERRFRERRFRERRFRKVKVTHFP